MTPAHRSAVAVRREFKSGAVTGFWNAEHTLYVVQSYGPHWPLAAWTQDLGWLVNVTRYHRPTTRRQAAEVTRAILGATEVYVDQLIAMIATHKPTIVHQNDESNHKPTNNQADMFEVSL